MSYCKIPIFLAYGMSIYVLASIYYMIRTKNIGTPFKDSLSKKQIQIKKESAKERSRIFYQGIGGAIILLIVFRPFATCM